MQQNMNNALQELQAALKAYEQLAPHANSIQQIQKICNDLNAQAAYMNQLPSLEQAYKLYQQAYPALLQLSKLNLSMIAMNQATESNVLVERLDELLKDIPESRSDCKATKKEDLFVRLVAIKEVLEALKDIGLDESTTEIIATLVAILACIIFILHPKDAKTGYLS